MYRPGPSLTVSNATTALQSGLQAIATGQTHFDLNGLAEVDSAALAVLLAWERGARRQGKSLSFANFPANLHALAEVYGVDELLPDRGKPHLHPSQY